MIHRWVSHNGALLPIEQVRLSPGQAGLLNGWGLFTTLRIWEGEPFAYERHWRRLTKDAARVHLPVAATPEKVGADLRAVLRKNQVKEGCARIYFVFNTAGFWRSDEPMPPVDVILYSAPLPDYREPARLALREHGRHAASPLAGVKTTAWLNNVWNLHEAQQKGYDEVVLLNERGDVAECTAANIFFVKGGKAYTPPLDSGCLEGVTRGVLLEVGAAAGVPTEERVVRPGDLFGADEVFITSTNRSLLPVEEIAGNRVAAAPGPVTKKLERAFSEFVQRDLARSRTTAGSGA
jgi:branched-chain amino acid aminotransferase